MSAARPHTRHGSPADAVEIQLPWWAIALPAIAFAALLLLIAGPGEAHAATADGTAAHFLGLLRNALTHLTP